VALAGHGEIACREKPLRTRIAGSRFRHAAVGAGKDRLLVMV
jgi:hypothetical protein